MIDLTRCRKVISFFAHPDDETIAAGATLYKLGNLGIEVHVAIPATGIYSRRNVLSSEKMDSDIEILKKNCRNALEVLGVASRNTYLGHFPDNEMDKGTLLELIHWFEGLLDKINPDLILTHHSTCTNIDHQYCYQAAVVAARPTVNSRIPVLCGEVLGSTGYIRPTAWEPNCYIDISESDLSHKLKAMDAYETEARKDPHPRSSEVLKALAKVRGAESGYNYAEAFMISRSYA